MLRTSAGLIFVASAALTFSARAGELPRYRLKIGQELTFSADNRVERTPKTMSKNEFVTCTDWVIGKAGEEGWKLVVRRDYAARYTDPSRKEQPIENSEAYHVELGCDGRLLTDSTLDIDRLRSFLPLLPKDQDQVRKGYEEKSEADGFRYQFVDNDGDQWEIEAVSQGLSAAIYEIDSKTTYTFDAERGLLVQAAMKSEWKSLLKSRLEGTLRLKSVKDRGAAWAAQAAAEAERYFAANRMLTKAYGDGKSDSMKKAVESLMAVRDEAKLKLFQKHLETDLKDAEQEVKRLEEGGSDTTFLGKTVDWTTTDLDGKKVSLSDFKGKVIVLDY